MESYQGYFVEQDRFVSTTPVRIPLRRRTVVTVYDEPAEDNYDVKSGNADEAEKENVVAETTVTDEPAEIISVSDEVARKLRCLEIINALLDESTDEEVPEFERANLHREVSL